MTTTKIKLGDGGSSTVHLGFFNKRPVAVKTATEEYFLKNSTDDLKKEHDIQAQLKHENIVEMLAFQKIHLILEWMEYGDLITLHKKNVSLTPDCYLSIANGLINGLHHIHEHNILHLDIKQDNALLNYKMEVKITDFGLAISQDKNQTEYRNKACGTLTHISPEIAEVLLSHTKEFPYSTKTDIYALGILLLEMVHGSQPYSSIEKNALCVMIANCSYRPIPQTLTPILKDIINNCLIKNPTHRITTAGLLALISPFMGNRDSMLAELQLNAAKSWDLDYIKTLVTYRPECLNEPDKQGFTLLHKAIYWNKPGIAEYLMVQDGIELNDMEGKSPLAWAKEKGYAEIIKLLNTYHATNQTEIKLMLKNLII